jgi:hypothetical protein
MAMPVDGDETMRVISSKVDTLHREAPRVGTQADTLHRETVRTQAPAEEAHAPAPMTIRTPLPSSAPPSSSPNTLLTPLPAGAPPTKMRAGLNPAYVVGFVAIIVIAVVVLLMLPGNKRLGSIVGLPETTTTAAPTTTTTAATTSQTPAQVAEASVTVTSGTADSTQLSAPTPATTATTQVTTTAPAIITNTPPTTTVAQVTPTPKPREQKPREVRPVEPKPQENADNEEETEREPSAPAFGRAATYQDGGDSDANDRAMAILRRELRGTTTVALRAGGMTAELTRALREEFPNIQFAGEANVVIRFNGRTDRLGAGRRRRAATATVEKNGRIVFRYELPDEVYRVGQGSVEAFANVLGEAFEE